ncbi:MAG: glycosyltransferase [Oscillospiraceae bacterium]|nr:glycosyltransferase [Oscillospiraceae bacterium]
MASKVLFCASTYSHICNFHLPYLKMFRDAGWQTHVACAGAETDIPWADAVIHLPFRKAMTAPGNLWAAAKLRRQIRAERYDLVITHTSLAAFFTRLAMLGWKRRPVVVNMVHGYLFDDRTGPAKRRLLLAAERLTAPVTDLVLTMNRQDYEIARRYRLADRVEEIPGVGVDFEKMCADKARDRDSLRRDAGIAQDAFVLFYAAELSKRKSQQVLIRAMAHLPECVVLVLAGEGAMGEYYRGLARRMGIHHRVILPGHVSDVGRWYAAADAVAASSRSEGLPFNIMEAMHCGVPVVASEVKGHTDLICHGETGLLYPYGDCTACAQAVQRLMDDPELARKLGANARERAAEYGIDSVGKLVFHKYISCVKQPAEV